jgi:2'-5' RNA ligase
MTEGPVHEMLYKTIQELSKEHSTPSFEPHITLIPEVNESETQVIEKTLHLAKSIKPFTVQLTDFGYRNEYFRCLFIEAELSDELTNANLKAREIFGRQDDAVYYPHLSLMYGDINLDKKKTILSELEIDPNLRLDVKSMDMFLSQGRVEEWYRVKRFPLNF